MDPGMETQARSVGLVSRLAAFVILYAFLVKTVLLLASPLATMPIHALGSDAPVFSGFALCTPTSTGAAAVDGEAPAPVPAHDSSCCLLHCHLQLAVVAPLVLAFVASWLRPVAQEWQPESRKGDGRDAAARRFQARGPPLRLIG